MKAKKLTGWVEYVERLGWIFLIVSESQYVEKNGYSLRRTKDLSRRYYLVDWSKDVDEVSSGLWEAVTGDFTERYHDDWVRPIQKVHRNTTRKEAV